MNPARNCVNLKKTVLRSKAFSGNLKNKTELSFTGEKKSEFNPSGLVIRALPSQLKSHPCKSENGNCFLLGSAETLPCGEVKNPGFTGVECPQEEGCTRGS